MNSIKYIIAFASFLMLISCNRDEHVNDLKFDPNGLCVLTDWLMVGPFKFDTIRQTPRETFSNRDLDDYSINEDSFKVDDLEMLKKKQIKNSYLLKRFATHDLKLYTDTVRDKSNCYLATVLESDQEQDLVLLVDGAASIKVWLNQQPVLGSKSNFNMLKIANRFIPVHIKKGKNVFFAKVNREANIYAWGFYLAITTQKGSAEIFRSNYMNDFVANPIVLDTLKFYGGSLQIKKAEVYSNDTIVSPEIFDQKNDNHYISGLAFLPEGFYHFRIITSNDTLTQIFYKGNILNFYQKLKASYLLDENKTNESQAMIQRIDFIIEKAAVFPPLTTNGYYHEGNIRQANTNLVYWVERFNAMAKKEGLMFKTYESPADKSVNHFILYVDKSLKAKADVPLVVVMPYAIQEPNFPTSWYICSLDQILVDCRLSSERGFAICWLFAKGSNYTLPASVEDFNCALNQIKNEFSNINVDKIYLTGDCLGAYRALDLAECVPERIKALSLKSPLPKMEYYKENIESLANTPLFIQHGIYDVDIPIEKMRLFITSISKEIPHLIYTEVEEGHVSFRKDNRKNTFDFFHQVARK
ncbi:MAG TPA: hypothetical protein VGK10_19475 [Prolixibacteraceae bacterium]|jgi:hypothetical protein